jgi:hypothetical protein
MAFIHKQTFDIIQDTNIDDCDIFLANYFEVDDELAPVIQELNRKHYYTSTIWPSLSVRPYDYVLEKSFAPNKEITIVDRSFLIENDDYGGTHILFRKPFIQSTYICFDEHVAIPALPEGFVYKYSTHSIERNYPLGLSPFEAFRFAVDVAEELYNWAKDLPLYLPQTKSVLIINCLE